jgi:phosphoglycerol transferase
MTTSLFAPIHSRSLRWSYPTMRGRAGATWARNTAALVPAALLPVRRRADFAGIPINRDLYPDRGTGIEAALGAILGGHLQVSRDGNLAFFSLT